MGDMYTNPPQSRNEAILRATIDGTEYTDPPQSRIEDLLLELKEAIEEGGGSVESYEQLTNKPQINGTTLSGDKSTEDLIPIDKGLEFDSDGKLAVSLGDGLAFNSDGEIDNLTEANPSDSATGELSKLKVGSDIYSVVTKAVNDLTNYYTKSEVYTKDEVNNIAQARFSVVAELPTQDIQTNVIYLVPKSTAQTNNDYDEYIYALKSTNPDTYGWEKIGDTEIDLSGYVTTSDLNTALADYTTTADLTTLLAGKEPTISVTANRALVSDANGKVSASNATSEEVGYLSGVTGAIQTQINGKADENEATPVSVSGNPITITDAANIPCESLSMTIEPIQSGSGTPSIDNVRPISGLTEANARTVGKNLIKYPYAESSKTYGNVTFTVNNDGSILVNGTANAIDVGICLISETDNYVIPKGLYILTDGVTKVGSRQTGVYVELWKNGQAIATVAGSYTSDTVLFDTSGYDYDGMRVGIYCYNGTANDNILFKPMIRKASITDATYEPYTENTATISFGSDTVYRGTIDFNTGILTLTWAGIDVTSGVSRYTDHLFYRPIDNAIKYTFSTDGLMCDKLPTANTTAYDRIIVDFAARLEFYTVNSYSSAADFLAAYGNSIQAVYKLATPQTVQLTPAQLTLLKGYNTVSANGATINLDYQKDNLAGDIKKWVLQQIQG